MLWLATAFAGYLFSATAALLEKYLLADRIKSPAMLPFGFRFFGWQSVGWCRGAGVLFLYGLTALYTAVKQSEVSRIAPLAGTVMSFVVLGLSAFLGTSETEGTLIATEHILAFFLLIGGGLLITFDLPLRKDEHVPALTIFSGILMALSVFSLKQGFESGNFVSGMVWSRLGIFVAGISLLAIPMYRTHILSGCCDFSSFDRKAMGTGAWFLANKLCAGLGSFLFSYAVFLGPVALVQALSGIQYALLLVLAFLFSYRYPHIFEERLYFWDWFQKAVAIILIGLGIWFSAFAGATFLMV